MKKKFLVAMIVVLFILFVNETGRARKPRTTQWNCCVLIFSTGRWLGWSAALLDVTRDRQRPDPFDRAIIRCLENVNPNLRGANQQCGQRTEVWPGWRVKQKWIETQIRELQTPSNSLKSHHTRRNEVRQRIENTYITWGNDLSTQFLNGRRLKQPTCVTYYFQFGFDTAFASQAFRQADGLFREFLIRKDQKLLGKGNIQIGRAQYHLRRVQKALEDYYHIQRRISFPVRCVNFSNINLDARIARIVSAKITINNYRSYKDEVDRISDDIGSVLQNICVVGTTGNAGGSGLTGIAVGRNTITISIHDFGSVDGDRINLFLNSRLIARNIKLTKKRITFTLNLPQRMNVLEVEALNEGTRSPNTASIEISNVIFGRRQQEWRLKTGQRGRMEIRVGR